MADLVVPSIRGEVSERYPGGRTTFAADAAITGGQLVEITGDMEVGPAGAASLKVVGVAFHDASNTGEVTRVSVAHCGVWALEADGAIAAGDIVIAGAAGTVVADNTPAAGAQVGLALAAIDDGDKGLIMLQVGGGSL